jgi:chromosome segregation ATPase
MPRALTIGLVLLAVAALAGGGYAIVQLSASRARTEARLARAQQTLQEQLTTLKTLEVQHEELAGSYDQLKAKWQSTDEELATLRASSTQLGDELAAAREERGALERKVEEAGQAKREVEQQLSTLERDLKAQRASQQRLQAEMAEAKTRALTPAEAAQLQEMVVDERRRAVALSDQLAALSRAYEGAVSSSALAPPTQPVAESTGQAQASAPASSVASEASARKQRREAAKHNRRLAEHYRRLAEGSAASYRYADAAALYERSLAHENSPDAHTQLALIYGRYLHDSKRAASHAAQADTDDPVRKGLAPMADQRGLPRSDWRILWSWLTD